MYDKFTVKMIASSTSLKARATSLLHLINDNAVPERMLLEDYYIAIGTRYNGINKPNAMNNIQGMQVYVLHLSVYRSAHSMFRRHGGRLIVRTGVPGEQASRPDVRVADVGSGVCVVCTYIGDDCSALRCRARRT